MDRNIIESLASVSLGITSAKNAWVELVYSFRYKFNQGSFEGKDLPVRRNNKENKVDKEKSISKDKKDET